MATPNCQVVVKVRNNELKVLERQPEHSQCSANDSSYDSQEIHFFFISARQKGGVTPLPPQAWRGFTSYEDPSTSVLIGIQLVTIP